MRVVSDKLADLPILLSIFTRGAYCPIGRVDTRTLIRGYPNSDPLPVFARPNTKVLSKQPAEVLNVEIPRFTGNCPQSIITGVQQLANPFQTHPRYFVMNRSTENHSEFGFQLSPRY